MIPVFGALMQGQRVEALTTELDELEGIDSTFREGQHDSTLRMQGKRVEAPMAGLDELEARAVQESLARIAVPPFNPQPSTLNKQHLTLNTHQSTLNTQHSHSTLNTQHSTLNTQHSTLNTQH